MDFPRPPIDTGFGIHDSADAYWKPDNWPEYARMLRDHGATWFLMWAFDQNKAPWAAELKRQGIEVILRLGPAKMPRPQIDMSVVDAYIAAGVRWFMLGNEYNLYEEWNNDVEPPWKNIEKPLRHIADWFVNISGQITAKGAWCLTPPPSLGGHWLHRDWFIRFLTALLNTAAERGISMDQLLWHCGIGIHCRSVGNPLEDGPEMYDCSSREWEWFDARVKEFVGHSLPMCNGEWGDEPGWCRRKHPEYQNPQKWQWWYDRNIEQIKWCNPANQGYKYPDHVFANCLWILHSPPPWNDCGLIHNSIYLAEMGGSDMTPLWNALPGLVTWNRAGAQPVPPEPVPPQPEPGPMPNEIEYVGLSQEMIDALRIDPPTNPTMEYWKVVKVEVQPQTDNQSAFAVLPPGSHIGAEFSWPGGAFISTPKVDPYAPPGAREWAASMAEFNAWGAYRVEIQGNSERLDGFGLYGDALQLTHTAHHPTLVYFQFVQPEPPVVPPEPPGPPIDPNIPYRLIDALNARLVAAGLGLLVDIRKDVEAKWKGPGVPGIRSVDADKRKEGFWNITLHHTQGTGPLDILSPNGIAHLHTVIRGWARIAYPIIIDKAGTVWFAKELSKYGPHSGNERFNKYSIPVAVHGDFTKESPPEAQLKALRCVVDTLEEWVGEHQGYPQPLPIVRHKDLVNTACPGSLYEDYRKYLTK